MKKKSTAVRVMAIICIVLLVGMYITSLVLAIIQHKSAGDLKYPCSALLLFQYGYIFS